MKKVFMISVPLLCLAVCIGVFSGIFADEAVWALPFAFSIMLLLFCIPFAVFRYIIRRAPIKNAKRICVSLGGLISLGLLRMLRMDSYFYYLDRGEVLAGVAGVAVGAVINYLMLSE